MRRHGSAPRCLAAWVPTALALVVLVAMASGCATTDAAPPVPAPDATGSTAGPAPVGTEGPGSTAPTTVAPTTMPPPSPPALPSPGDNRVYVLGDSVILGAQYDVPKGLAGWQVTFDAQESRLVNHGLDVLRGAKKRIDDLRFLARVDLEKAYADAGKPPPAPEPALSTLDALGHVQVISLCTNYLAGGGFDQFIDQYMAYLAGAARVVWLTCGEWSSGQTEANAAIRAAATKFPNVVACDWAAYASTPGYTYEDGIHLTDTGRVAMGDLVARCVGPAPTPLPPAPTTTRPKPTSTTTTTTPIPPPTTGPPETAVGEPDTATGASIP